MPSIHIQALEKICFNFIWKSKSNNKKVIEKIKRNVMSLTIDEGGAGMIKCSSQQNLFLIKWILKSTVVNKVNLINMSKIPDIYFAFYGGLNYFLSFNCTFHPTFEFPHFISRFWKDAIKAWFEATPALN